MILATRKSGKKFPDYRVARNRPNSQPKIKEISWLFSLFNGILEESKLSKDQPFMMLLKGPAFPLRISPAFPLIKKVKERYCTLEEECSAVASIPRKAIFRARTILTTGDFHSSRSTASRYVFGPLAGFYFPRRGLNRTGNNCGIIKQCLLPGI